MTVNNNGVATLNAIKTQRYSVSVNHSVYPETKKELALIERTYVCNDYHWDDWVNIPFCVSCYDEGTIDECSYDAIMLAIKDDELEVSYEDDDEVQIFIHPLDVDRNIWSIFQGRFLEEGNMTITIYKKPLQMEVYN